MSAFVLHYEKKVNRLLFDRRKKCGTNELRSMSANKLTYIRARITSDLKNRIEGFCAFRGGRNESDLLRDAVLDYLDREEARLNALPINQNRVQSEEKLKAAKSKKHNALRSKSGE
jgi:hypothetical protein